MARSRSAAKRTTRWGKKSLVVVAGAALAAAPLIALPAFQASGPSTSHVSSARLSSQGFSSASWGDDLADQIASALGFGYTPSSDPGSLSTVENAIGARKVWATQDSAGRPITGKGVTVALLDSGTASVQGLNAPGKLTYGPDLSIEGNGVLTDKDTFGHGTHMAGIIAGRDGAALTSTSAKFPAITSQLGIAPDAGLLSLKLATTDGSTDVSQVIAALNWVTEHQTAADGSRVRVVNLSFGTESVQSYQLDPLAAAAENAWRHGLVVVVSAGNDGNASGVLTDPAIDPYVIAVGAADSGDSILGWKSPSVASFSNGGTASRHVDLLAPGRSIVSLRDPGSYVDVNHPEGLVAGDSTGRLFRGSGTSQAAAVVSGSAALLLQANPNLTPDQVKQALVSSADPVSASPLLAGAGELNISAAVNLVLSKSKKLVDSQEAPVTQNFALANGQGSLDAARGGSALVDADGAPINGEVDVQGNTWNAAAWWSAASTLKSWSGGKWLGTTYTGDAWVSDPSNPGGSRWSSAKWTSARWSDADWSSAKWSSAKWSSAKWSSAKWSSAKWSSAKWSDSGWN